MNNYLKSGFILLINLYSMNCFALDSRLSTPTLKAPLTISKPVTTPTITATTTLLKPKITGYNITSCAKTGTFIHILGSNFGTEKGVALGGNGINVTLKPSEWTSTKIIAYIPKDARIKGGYRYYIGINDTKTKNWLSNIDKMITMCKTSATLTTAVTTPELKLTTKTPTITRPTTSTTIPTTPKVVAPVIPAPTTPTIPTPRPTAPTPATSSAPKSTGTTPPSSAPPNEETDSYTDYYAADEQGWEDYQWEDYSNYGPEPTTQAVLPNSYGSLMNRQLPEPPPNLKREAQTARPVNKNAEPNELVVISGDMNEARQLAQQLGGYGLSAKRRKVLKNLGLVITTFRVPADVDLQQTAIDVRQAHPKMWADINHRYSLLGDNRSTHAAKKIIGWNEKTSQCGKGIRIGLLDTEVSKQHPALKSQNIISHSILSHGIKKAKADHGTAIATLLVGDHNSKSFSGMLPSAKLFNAAIFRQRDKHNIDTTAEWIVNGLDWLVSQKVQVINLSIGGPRNLLVDVAIQRIIQSGVPVVAAAGNGGSSATPVYPAAQPGVIAVTAVDSDMDLYSKANHGKYIDFAAPGVDIWTGNEKGKGKFVSGTSFSVPFVTASMASLLKQLGPRKAYDKLQKSAKDLGTQGKDEEFGWGLIRAADNCNSTTMD